MDRHDKEQLALETKRKHTFQKIKTGAGSIFRSKTKPVILLGYLAAVVAVYIARDNIFIFGSASLFAPIYHLMLPVVIMVAAAVGLYGFLLLFGTPRGGGSVNNGLQRIGLKNHAGESPLLIGKRKDKENPRTVEMEFVTNGIPLVAWEEKRAHIESALNVNIIKITQGKSKKRILLYTVPASSSLPDRAEWRREYLSQAPFVLVLGKSLLGFVSVNLANIPHVLLGGSTGSGKSAMLKLLLMQCVQKGATVFLADFKGGVDFPGVWDSRCRMVLDEDTLLNVLDTITDTLKERMEKLRAVGCANIDQYNRQVAAPMPRIVFACDEVAALLDKTGLSKSGKDKIARIEGKLAEIARLGRAFGIHLILATQRPDATILAGQIRNNIDCRICGRADDILSKIILDNTDASERIPKDAQGRFLLHDGTLFQGYWVDEKGWCDG